MASATFGLIIGGLVGGPVAKFLIKRNQLAETVAQETNEQQLDTSINTAPFEYPKKTRLITASNAVSTLGMFALCIFVANEMTEISQEDGLNCRPLSGP